MHSTCYATATCDRRVSMDLDAPRTHGFLSSYTHMQESVTVMGLDLIGVDILGERDHTMELPLEAFAPIIGRMAFFDSSCVDRSAMDEPDRRARPCRARAQSLGMIFSPNTRMSSSASACGGPPGCRMRSIR